MSLCQLSVISSVIYFLILFNQSFGKNYESSNSKDHNLKNLERGYIDQSKIISDDHLARLIIVNLNTNKSIQWTQFGEELKTCGKKYYDIIIPGNENESTLRDKKNILDNYFIKFWRSSLKCQYYIDTTDLFENFQLNDLKIYQNLGKILSWIIPKRTGIVNLIGEGVSFILLDVIANDLNLHEGLVYVKIISFNPLLSLFQTDNYKNFDYIYVELIFSGKKQLSEKEFNKLQSTKFTWRVWLFSRVLNCKNKLCSYKKASTMYVKAHKSRLKNYKNCKLNGSECLMPYEKAISSENGVFRFSKARNDKDFYIEEVKNEIGNYKIENSASKNFPASALTKRFIINLNTTKTINWEDFKNELKNCNKKIIEIIVPGNKTLSTLQGKKNIWDNYFIKYKRSEHKNQYFIDTTHLFGKNMSDDLKMHETFGKMLSAIMPEKISTIILIGETVSTLSLSVMAKDLKVKTPEAYVDLLIFNPIVSLFRTDNFETFIEFIFSDMSLCDENELVKLQNKYKDSRLWLFTNTLECKEILCSYKKVSTMYAMARKGILKNYKSCQLNGSECLMPYKELIPFELGVFRLLKVKNDTNRHT